MRESHLLLWALLLAVPSLAFDLFALWGAMDMERRMGPSTEITNILQALFLGLPISVLTAPILLIVVFKNARRVSTPARWGLLFLGGSVIVPFLLFASFTLGGGWGGG